MEVREVSGVLSLGGGEPVNKEEDTDRNNDYIVSQSSKNVSNLSWEKVFKKILFLQFCCILQKIYRSYDFIIIIEFCFIKMFALVLLDLPSIVVKVWLLKHKYRQHILVKIIF